MQTILGGGNIPIKENINLSNNLSKKKIEGKYILLSIILTMTLLLCYLCILLNSTEPEESFPWDSLKETDIAFSSTVCVQSSYEDTCDPQCAQTYCL